MTDFARTSPYPMVSIDEAQQQIAALVQPLPTETVASTAAAGRVVATDIIAPADLPDSARAIVDGYALRVADGTAPRRVLHEVTANAAAAAAQPITAGTAVRIMTGGVLPPGADAVVMVEQTSEQDGTLTLTDGHAPDAGANIRVVGADVAQGELVIPQGATLGAPEVGLLATIGQLTVPVYRRPRVAVLATGDELIEPDAPPRPGSVRDSNRYALLAAVAAAGGEPFSLGIARDDLATQRERLQYGMANADMVLSSGGVSMGTRDLIKPLLAELGTVHFGRVAFKPGKPTTFATAEHDGRRVLLFGLPGFPASSLVSFEVFVRPALRRLQGDATPDRPRLPVVLTTPIRPSPDRPEYQRVVIRWQDGHLTAQSTGPQISSRMLSLRSANGLLIVPAGSATYPAGSPLDALLIGAVVVD